MAIFMVVMVLSIVSAIGIFSARAASQVDTAAGQARHAIQAQYAAEFAMRALTADIGKAPDVYLKTLSGHVGERGNCRFINSPSCSRKESGDILQSVLEDPAGIVEDPLPGGLIGALNHDEVPSGGSVGSFTLEMDDLSTMPGNLPGFDKIRTYEIAVLAVGQVMPAGAPAGSCTASFTMTSGLQRVRGQITFGPFPE